MGFGFRLIVRGYVIAFCSCCFESRSGNGTMLWIYIHGFTLDSVMVVVAGSCLWWLSWWFGVIVLWVWRYKSRPRYPPHMDIKLSYGTFNGGTENQLLQYTTPPNVWFGAFPTNDYDISADYKVVKKAPRDAETHFSLVGCTVAPAFQFEDFVLAKRSDLLSRFPAHESLISLITFED